MEFGLTRPGEYKLTPGQEPYDDPHGILVWVEFHESGAPGPERHTRTLTRDDADLLAAYWDAEGSAFMQLAFLEDAFPYLVERLRRSVDETSIEDANAEVVVDAESVDEPGAQLELAFQRSPQPPRPVSPVKRHCRGCDTVWIDNPFTMDYSWRPPNKAIIPLAALAEGTPRVDINTNIREQLADADRGVLIVSYPNDGRGSVEVLCRHEPALVDEHDVKWSRKYLEDFAEMAEQPELAPADGSLRAVRDTPQVGNNPNSPRRRLGS